jgi:3-deoxy-D-manno-octulosonate cytidylyltransferase
MNAPRLRALAIVPARLASQRLPRKMLLAETGRPLVVHTATNLANCRALQRVVVATDSEEIHAAVVAAGLESVLTSPEHVSGTDRVHEALEALGADDWDVVVNAQGDEPELDLDDLARLVDVFDAPQVEAATLCGRIEHEVEAQAPQVVKVVRDAQGNALYFSRSAIPHRPTDAAASYARADAPPWLGALRRHIGVYAFRPQALARFVRLPRGVLERLENLEQLRWLEAGHAMRVVEARTTPLGIDTRLDYDAFAERVRSVRAP